MIIGVASVPVLHRLCLLIYKLVAALLVTQSTGLAYLTTLISTFLKGASIGLIPHINKEHFKHHKSLKKIFNSQKKKRNTNYSTNHLFIPRPQNFGIST